MSCILYCLQLFHSVTSACLSSLRGPCPPSFPSPSCLPVLVFLFFLELPTRIQQAPTHPAPAVNLPAPAPTRLTHRWAQSDSRTPSGISHIADNTSSFSAKWLVDAPAGSRVKIRIEDGKKHWVNTYAEVHLGSTDACVNPDYDEPTEPARPPPPTKINWWRGFEFLVLGAAVLLAMVGIAAGINRANKKNEEEEVRGEYARVGDGEEIQMSRVGGRVTRRITPTRPSGEGDDEEGEGRGEEYRSLIGRRE